MWWQRAALLIAQIPTLASLEYKFAVMGDGSTVTVVADETEVTPNQGFQAPGTVWSFPDPTIVFCQEFGSIRTWANFVFAGKEFSQPPLFPGHGEFQYYVLPTESTAEVTFSVDGALAHSTTVSALTVGKWKPSNLYGKRVEILSTTDVLVSLQEWKGAHAVPRPFLVLPPVAETIYGQCSPNCNIKVWGGDTSVLIERTCTDGTVAQVTAGSYVGLAEYAGVSCKWTAPAGYRISGTAVRDAGTEGDYFAFVRAELFQLITPVPTYMDFLLLISTAAAQCSYSGNSVTLSGGSGVFHARLTAVSAATVIECDMPVTVVGKGHCLAGAGACYGKQVNLIAAPLTTTTTTSSFTATSTTASSTGTSTTTVTTSTTATTSSSSSSSSTATSVTMTTMTTITTVTTHTMTSSTVSTTTATSSSSSSSSTTTSVTTATTTTMTSLATGTTTSTTSSSSSNSSTTASVTTGTTTTPTTTTTFTMTTHTTTLSTASTTTTTSSSSSSSSSTTMSVTTRTATTTSNTTTSSSVTLTTVSATNTTHTVSATNTSHTMSTSTTATSANNSDLAAAPLMDRLEKLEASLLKTLVEDNRTSVTEQVDGETLVAVKIDVAAVMATGGGLTVPLEGTQAKVTAPASFFSSLPPGVGDVVLTVALVDLVDFGNESEVQVAAAVNVNLLTLGGRYLNVTSLVDPIEVTMPVNGSAGLQCVFWDEEQSDWATKGVELGSADEGTVVCKSTHLTLFAAIIRGFVNTLECAQVSLLTADSIKELWKGKWASTTGARLLWPLVGTFTLLLSLAAWLDWMRWKQGSSSDEHLLIPLRAAGEAVQPQDQTTGAADEEADEEQRGSCGCAGFAEWCSSSAALRDALDDVVSNWFSYFGEVRSLVESLTSGLELCSGGVPRCWRVPPAAVLVDRVMRRTLISSAQQQAATSLRVSGDVFQLVLEDESVLSVVQAHQKRAVDPASIDLPSITSRSAVAREEFWGQLHRALEIKLGTLLEASARWSSLPGMVCRLFLNQNPITTCLVNNVFMGCKLRVLLLTIDIVGAVLLATFFHTASGVPSKRSRSLDCEFQGFEYVGRMWAIGTASVLVSGIPGIILSSLCTRSAKRLDYEGCRTWKRQLAVWRVQDKAICIFAIVYLLFCILFVSVFLANVDQKDHGGWLLGILIGVVEDMVVIPLTVALVLALLSTTSLQFMSRHRRITKGDLISELHFKFMKESNMTVVVGTV